MQAQDVAITARLDAAEAALRALVTSLDTSLRAHVQEAVAVTQTAVTTLSERVHPLDTAGGLTASPAGLVPPEARTALDTARFEKRCDELDLKLLGVRTEVAEQKAQRLGTERDLCTGVGDLRQDLARLEAQIGSSIQALGECISYKCSV